ncbi:MAG: hypothetical protein ABI262_05670 [Microcoleus sp.]|jgi:hypothetical protein
MLNRQPNLPDSFIERVTTLEIKLAVVTKEVEGLKLSHTNHKRETRRIREVIGLFSWVPGGPKSFLFCILAVIFFSSLMVEILLKTTGLHLEIRRYLIDILEVK